MGNLFSMLFASRITSGSAIGLALINSGQLLVRLGSGESLWAIAQSDEFKWLIASIGFLGAKDFDVHGGTRLQ